MAKTRDIPVYNKTYTFVRELYRIKIKLPKSLKHDLGQESCLSALKLLEFIVLANRAQNKEKYLEDAILQIEIQWVLMRLMLDLKGISAGEFKVLSEKLTLSTPFFHTRRFKQTQCVALPRQLANLV